MKIVVDDKIPYLQGVLERYFSSVVYLPGKAIGPNDVKDADALLVRTRTRCDEALLAGSAVKVIATATIGFDHIDAEFCRKAGIKWFNAPGCNAFGVVQYVLCALAHLSAKYGIRMQGKTLGIVGVGEVGKRLAAVAPYFGLRVLLNDPPRQRKESASGFVSIDEICQKADIITFHVPLIRQGADTTFHLFDDAFVGKLSSPKILINASRGEVVNTASLIAALRKGDVSHAVVDVWENEPDISRELVELASIATPHIAGYSLEGKANGTSIAVNGLLRFFGFAESPWFPADLPQKEHDIDFGKALSDVNCLLQTYPIAEDDRQLRSNLNKFEDLRGNYGVRREISYFRVNNIASAELRARLRGLTFEVK